MSVDPFSQNPAAAAADEERAEILFFAALEHLPGERQAFLDEQCGSDMALLAKVEGLVRDYHEAGSFLTVDAPLSPELQEELSRLKPEEAGERIGNYKLLQQIGEGGFGTVWMAEQEKPVRRRVAVKIIKLGMDTKEVIARFEQERQALAMMDHPNIAKVFDAGATPFGRPFFVMELVKGVKITEYCDSAKLPTADRLALFIQVCNAVQHAHQKGIIHRDLKPSNILVTLHDGVPVPKVIDFGVAKATQQQRLTDLTLFTQFEQMVGTPLYMSPEQAELSGLDIDTRSDIYSLGVLLYELLTGRTPFDPETLMKAGFDEMRRVIREQEPQKPSTFVSTMALDLRTNAAQQRQTDIAKLTGQIRGDLDWIVMKALEKDRSRRYETANSFARDIERHLLNEPVQARPPTQLYRFRRFAKRNKGVFAAGSAVLMALLIGLGVSTWMFFKEKHAREQAVAAENKSGQVAQFLAEMLNGVGPSVALGRDTKLLREILDKTAERIAKDLKNQPDVEADLRSIIGSVHLGIGEYEKARAMHSEALAMRRKLLGNEHPKVAESLYHLANALERQQKVAEAETMHLEALAMRRKLLGNVHPDVAASLNGLANLVGQRNPVEAELILREALAMQRKLLGDENPTVAVYLGNLGLLLEIQGNFAEAETVDRQALAMKRKLLGNEHPDVANSIGSLALVIHHQYIQGREAEAEAMYREALAMKRKLLGTEHPNVAKLLHNLAELLRHEGRLTESESMHREALAIRKKFLPMEHPEVKQSLTSLATVLRRQGKLAELETLQSEAISSDPQSAVWLRSRGNMSAREGRWKEAGADLTKAIELDPEDQWTWFQLAPLLIQNGETEAYRRHWKAMFAKFGASDALKTMRLTAKTCLLLPSAEGDTLPEFKLSDEAVAADTNWGAFVKALLEYRSGHFENAVEWTNKALASETKVPERDATAYALLAMARHGLNQSADAKTALARSSELIQTKLPTIESGDVGAKWHDWMIVHLLFREAKALIEPEPSPAP